METLLLILFILIIVLGTVISVIITNHKEEIWDELYRKLGLK